MEKKNLFKKLEKIVVNVGVGRARQQAQFEEKILPEITKDVATITGQKPAPRQAKKAIAGFKSREGDIIGLQVTLRGRRMNDFGTKVIRIVLPRVKDFRGLEMKSVDGSGNLNIGFREQYVFPEIEIEKSRFSFGLQATFVPAVKNREKALELYEAMGVPLKDFERGKKN